MRNQITIQELKKWTAEYDAKYNEDCFPEALAVFKWIISKLADEVKDM